MTTKPTVAVVDDDQIYRLTMTKLLQSTELVNTILQFENGKLVLEYLEKNNNSQLLPDIILLDINMPIMNGWGVLEGYKKIQPMLKKQPQIYMVSSSSNEEDIAKVKSYGFVKDYIVKPIRRDGLLELLKLY